MGFLNRSGTWSVPNGKWHSKEEDSQSDTESIGSMDADIDEVADLLKELKELLVQCLTELRKRNSPQ